MANMMDYLQWRGDIPFDCQGVNEVDNLIFSMMVYVDLLGIVPADPNAEGITLREAAKEYFFTHDKNQKYPLGLIIPPEVLDMFRQMADLPRYANIKMTGYVNEICEAREMQFSALTLRLPGGDAYVIFRGTDDTLVGWKEDFKLAYMDEVPSQRKAVQYLESVELPDTSAGVYISGHSKGGNLSVWAATHARREVRDRIRRVYCNDGPGFKPGVVQSEAYRAMRDKFVMFVPQSSIIGLLLYNDGGQEIVLSKAKGVLQHNPLTWQVMGGRLLRAPKLEEKARRTELVMRERISRMSDDERRMLVEMLFDVIESAGAKTLTEFNEGKFRRAFTMLRTVSELDKTTKETAQFLISKVLDFNISVEPTMAGLLTSTKDRRDHVPVTRSVSKPLPAIPMEVIPNPAPKARIRVQWRFGRQLWL